MSKKEQSELAHIQKTMDKMASILTRTANALKGEPDGFVHLWHDLPEVVESHRALAKNLETHLSVANDLVEKYHGLLGWAVKHLENLVYIADGSAWIPVDGDRVELAGFVMKFKEAQEALRDR